MILPFSTQINGKETFFVEKIQVALRLPFFKDSVGFHEGFVPPNFNFYVKSKCKPKLHTLRDDINDRWHRGIMIDFFINVRQKNMFRFAPVLPVVRVQNIEIIYVPFGDKKQDARPFVRVDGRLIYDVGQTLWSQMKEFAENDGFESVNDFFEYFNKDFTGKLIHWTDLKY